MTFKLRPVASFYNETKVVHTGNVQKNAKYEENFYMLSDNFSSLLGSCKRWNETARQKAQIGDNFWN